MAKISHSKNCKAAQFKVGDHVRHIGGDDQSTYVVAWVSKGSTCRGDQVIATTLSSNFVEASIYVGVE